MNFIFENIVYIWGEGFFGKILALLFVLTIGTLLFLISWGIFVAADSWYVSNKIGNAVVVDKSHHSAYTSVISTGKIVVPVYHPERWSIGLAKDGLMDDVDVSKKSYDSINLKETYEITYRVGRLSSDMYIESIGSKK